MHAQIIPLSDKLLYVDTFVCSCRILCILLVVNFAILLHLMTFMTVSSQIKFLAYIICRYPSPCSMIALFTTCERFHESCFDIVPSVGNCIIIDLCCQEKYPKRGYVYVTHPGTLKTTFIS